MNGIEDMAYWLRLGLPPKRVLLSDSGRRYAGDVTVIVVTTVAGSSKGACCTDGSDARPGHGGPGAISGS